MDLFKKTLIAAGTAAIALSPIAAAVAAAPVAARSAPAGAADSQLRGGNNGQGAIFAALAIAAGVGVYFITKDDDNDNVVSP